MSKKIKEFTSTPIRLMGEEYYFKRCPTEELKKYDEKIQKKLEDSEDIRKIGSDLEEELDYLFINVSVRARMTHPMMN